MRHEKLEPAHIKAAPPIFALGASSKPDQLDPVFDGASFALGALPDEKLCEKRKLPATSGVYVVADEFGTVYYVGQSKNILKRWRHHAHLPALKALSRPLRIYFTTIQDRDARMLYEAACIKHFAPAMNIRHPTTALVLCKFCGGKCRLAGQTPIGNQRYRCMSCEKTQTAKLKEKLTNAEKSRRYRRRLKGEQV